MPGSDEHVVRQSTRPMPPPGACNAQIPFVNPAKTVTPPRPPQSTSHFHPPCNRSLTNNHHRPHRPHHNFHQTTFHIPPSTQPDPPTHQKMPPPRAPPNPKHTTATTTTTTTTTTSRLSTFPPSVKPRQLSHLHSQLAQLQAHMADLENLLRMTAVQAEHVRALGGYCGGL